MSLGDKFCSTCGSELTTKPNNFAFCPKCGYELDEPSAFCPNCGQNLTTNPQALPVNMPNLGQLQGALPALVAWPKERWMFLLSGLGTIFFSLFGWASVRGADMLQMLAREIGLPIGEINTSFSLFSLFRMFGTVVRLERAAGRVSSEVAPVQVVLGILIAILLVAFALLAVAAIMHFKGKQWKVFATVGFILALLLVSLWIIAVVAVNALMREEFGFSMLRLTAAPFIVLASSIVGLIFLKKAKA